MCCAGNRKPGHFALGGSSVCTACFAGSYGDKARQSACTSCLPGRFQNETGQLACEDCDVMLPQLLTTSCPTKATGGALSGCQFKGGSLHDSLTVLAGLLESTLPSFKFACPTKFSTMSQPWRFGQFRGSWRFRSWRLPPLNSTPPFR